MMNLCVVNTLREYSSRTSYLRGNEIRLLISFLAPHKAVTKSTIGRWIKTVLSESGINDTYKAPSTRAGSTSAAKNKFLCIDKLKEVAGWKSAEIF